jgi:hypothetical protein
MAGAEEFRGTRCKPQLLALIDRPPTHAVTSNYETDLVCYPEDETVSIANVSIYG